MQNVALPIITFPDVLLQRAGQNRWEPSLQSEQRMTVFLTLCRALHRSESWLWPLPAVWPLSYNSTWRYSTAMQCCGTVLGVQCSRCMQCSGCIQHSRCSARGAVLRIFGAQCCGIVPQRGAAHAHARARTHPSRFQASTLRLKPPETRCSTRPATSRRASGLPRWTHSPKVCPELCCSALHAPRPSSFQLGMTCPRAAEGCFVVPAVT